jgi:hypothetical protein
MQIWWSHLSIQGLSSVCRVDMTRRIRLSHGRCGTVLHLVYHRKKKKKKKRSEYPFIQLWSTVSSIRFSCLVNDTFGTTTWLFQDVSDVTFIVFHQVVRQCHLLRQFSRRFLIVLGYTFHWPFLHKMENCNKWHGLSYIKENYYKRKLSFL